MRLTFLKALGNMHIWIATLFLQIPSPLRQFTDKYIFKDTGFLKWLVIAMILDLITGVTKAYKQGGIKNITSKGLRDTVKKCIQYGALLIVTNVLTHYEIDGVAAIGGMMWLNKLAMEFILIIECKSVYENIVAIDSSFDFVSFIWAKLVRYFPIKTKENETVNKK